MLIFLPIPLHFPRRDSINTYQNRKLQPKSCAKPRKIAAFCRIYSQAPRFSSKSSSQSGLKAPFHCFYLADVRPFVPSPPPSVAAASALSAAFRHSLPVLPQKPRVFGDFPSIFAATSTRQRLYLVLTPKKPTSRAHRSVHDSQQNANNADRRSRTKSSTAAAKRKHRARLNPRRRRGRVAPRGCA